MSVQEQITDKIQSLPEDKQQEVLIFIEFLLQKKFRKVLKRKMRNGTIFRWTRQ